jgi:hypothetical protein
MDDAAIEQACGPRPRPVTDRLGDLLGFVAAIRTRLS